MPGVMPLLNNRRKGFPISMRIRKYMVGLLLLAVVGSNLTAVEVSGGGPPKRCPIHRLPLKKERLEIIYGLVAHPCASLERIEFAGRKFPYANSVVYGGCVIEPDSPKYQEVLYCEECRKAEKDSPCLETIRLPIIEKLP